MCCHQTERTRLLGGRPGIAEQSARAGPIASFRSYCTLAFGRVRPLTPRQLLVGWDGMPTVGLCNGIILVHCSVFHGEIIFDNVGAHANPSFSSKRGCLWGFLPGRPASQPTRFDPELPIGNERVIKRSSAFAAEKLSPFLSRDICFCADFLDDAVGGKADLECSLP